MASVVVLGLLCTGASVRHLRRADPRGRDQPRHGDHLRQSGRRGRRWGWRCSASSPGPGAVAGLLLILAGSWLSTGGRLPPRCGASGVGPQGLRTSRRGALRARRAGVEATSPPLQPDPCIARRDRGRRQGSAPGRSVGSATSPAMQDGCPGRAVRQTGERNGTSACSASRLRRTTSLDAARRSRSPAGVVTAVPPIMLVIGMWFGWTGNLSGLAGHPGAGPQLHGDRHRHHGRLSPAAHPPQLQVQPAAARRLSPRWARRRPRDR